MKIKCGDVVHVKFYDHCQYQGAPQPGGEYLELEVYGKVADVTPRSIEITTWNSIDSVYSANNEGFSLLRSTIISIRKLVPKK